VARDFHAEATQEARQSEAARQWVRQRVATLRDRVEVGDVLARYGSALRYNGHKPEQFSCPFHGKDNKPSTRYYPATDGKPAGVWCFVCQEKWDCIALFKKFEQLDVPFTRLLALMERAFGLPTPELPREVVTFEEGPISTEAEQLLGVCERRLRAAKPSFTMDGYLRVGSVLDRLRWRLTNGKQTNAEAVVVMRQVLDKIGAKERQR